MITTIISWCLLTLMIVITGSIVFYSFKNGITPTPTLGMVKQGLMAMLSQQQINGNLYELGAGWGTLAFALAKEYKHCNIYGYENSTFPYFFSQIRNLCSRYRNVKLFREDFYDVSLHDADLVVCCLYTRAMQKLRIKFENELKKDALVVSHTFAVPDWTPVDVFVAADLYRTKIYLYIVGRH